MRCPSCGYGESKVVDSRPADDGASIRRRRECLECGNRSNPRNEITSKELGDLTLSYLADLDEVAYIRFASVYKDFQNIEEFSNALHNIHR